MRMHENREDTPPSSVNGDEISGNADINDEGLIYVDDLEEIQVDDENMPEIIENDEDFFEMSMPVDHAIMLFDEHRGSVFCCDLHPDGKLAVTGGEDDKAYVWSVESGNVVFNCEGHKDSVIFAGFSFDGAYVATADMRGLIKVWKCNLSDQGDQWPLAFQFETDEVSWGEWHFGARVLIIGVMSGDIYVFKIPSGEVKVLKGHNVRTECGKLFHDGVRLVAGYEDGAIKIWDLKAGIVLQQVPASVHQDRVNDIDVSPDDNLIASVSSDNNKFSTGRVFLTTSNNGKVVGVLETGIDLERVAFAQDPEMGYVALGTLKGDVTIWDVARQSVRHHCTRADGTLKGITKMIWVDNHLVTTCLDGSIRIYEGRSGEHTYLLTGHTSEIMDFCYNDKEKILLTASDDGTARIYNYEIKPLEVMTT